MKGIKVNIDDVKVSNNFDMVKLIVRIVSITKGLSLSETELHALTYFSINGYTKVSRENLIEIKVLKNKQTVSNLVHNFRKYGIVVKKHLGEELHQDFRVYNEEVDVVKIEMLIKK